MQQAIYILNIILFSILFGGYCVLITTYQKWFLRLKQFPFSSEIIAGTGFSIIIAARNEEANIENVINSIFKNNYPTDLFEVIIVDDFSEDKTVSVAQNLQQKLSNIQIIELKKIVDAKLNSYKKKAIETGISKAKFDWIITTDADCTAQKNWLKLFDQYIQKNKVVFIAAPVMFINKKKFLPIFQCLDFISLQGITAASVSAGFLSMCNGANLCYKKSAFESVNGFKNIDNIASGDDMLLMHKIKSAFPNQLGYLFNPNAVISTLSQESWKKFFNQRIRWASKATSYDDKKIFLTLLLVYCFNLYLFILPFLAFYSLFYLKFWLILLAGKTIVELSFMFPVADFFSMKKLLWWFPIMQPIHILYTIVAGFLGKFGSYEWKGRSVK